MSLVLPKSTSVLLWSHANIHMPHSHHHRSLRTGLFFYGISGYYCETCIRFLLEWITNNPLSNIILCESYCKYKQQLSIYSSRLRSLKCQFRVFCSLLEESQSSVFFSLWCTAPQYSKQYKQWLGPYSLPMKYRNCLFMRKKVIKCFSDKWLYSLWNKDSGITGH